MTGILVATGLVTAGSAASGAPRVPAAPPAASTPPSTKLSVDQALAQATATGKAVAVDAATTPTDTLTANPNGSLTVTRSVAPVRKLLASGWSGLDATLHANADGTVSPAVTTTTLSLSGGGTGPLAVLHSGARSLALVAPMTLPAPTISGPTATYPGVLSGVDLQVTADLQGGFSEVFVVHDATAAANPALKQLAFGAQPTGVAVSTDSVGNLTAGDIAGRAVFTAPQPRMWDSTTPTGVTPVTDPMTGVPVDPATGQPVGSSIRGPGEAAHTAGVGVAATASAVTLTPDPTLLGGGNVTYPLYIDPTWSTLNPPRGGWATVAQQFGSTNYWNRSPDPQGYMQAGNGGNILSRTLVNFPINTAILAGASINSAQLNIFNNYSWSCSASVLNVYAPATTLTSSNATWNYWAGVNLGSVAASQNVAHGHSSSCPGAGIGFDVKNAVAAAAAANRTTQTFVLVAGNEGDTNSWKEFQATSPSLSITYNHPPNTPTGLSTSPATACAASTPTVVGDAAIYLYAPVSDPDGGVLDATFELLKSATGPVIATAGPLTYASGTTAVYVVPKASLESAAAGAVTQFWWHAKVTDSIATSPWSTACTFSFDPTRPGQATITPPATPIKIRQPNTFTLGKPPTGPVPTEYLYQLNGGAPATIGADAQGNATITVTPTRFTNVLTVNSLSVGGNFGDTASRIFTVDPTSTDPQADQDLTGDNIPDLLTVGGQNGIPAGLWLAQGQASAGHTTGTGQIIPAATDIGANGWKALGGTPGDFTGSQAIAGNFSTSGLQDVMAYKASTGGGHIFFGNGDGSALSPATVANLPDGTFNDGGDFDPDPGVNPTQIANAGNSSRQDEPFPDIVGVTPHHLDYYISEGTAGAYSAQQLGTLTPENGYDWSNWTVTTCQIGSRTDMFLWDKTTGNLYLWQNLHYDPTAQALGYTTQRSIASGWNRGLNLTLQAADINGDQNPDLFAFGSTGPAVPANTVTAYLISSSTIQDMPSQQLLTSNHTWLLNDPPDPTKPTGPVTSTGDVTGTPALAASGTGGVTWNGGDLFTPDVAFNGTSGALSTTGPAVTTNTDFSISAWVKPHALGGTVLSQDGGNTAGFTLFADAGTGQWAFAMTTSGGADQYVRNLAGPVATDVWSHITATYNATSGVMALYVNGNPSGSMVHTGPWNATGPFHIGEYRNNGSYTGFFNGQVAQVQTWQQTLSPDQVAQMSGTPGYIMFAADGTSYGGYDPTTWTSRCATMTFLDAQLSITTTCSGTRTVNFGVLYPYHGTLVLQKDGDLQIEGLQTIPPSPPGFLWHSGTGGHPGATMFLQNDGNLVIYNTDGATLWSSGTANAGTSFHAHANGKFVCAENAGNNPLIANRTVVSTWETFDRIDLGGGNIALHSHANGMYVTAENAGNNPLIANRNTVGTWETFQLIQNPDGSISLKSAANGLYVTADNAGNNPLIANRTTIGPWEEFDQFGS